MGHSAKITRGGNKKRVHQGRAEAKLRAQGAKTHSTSVKEAVDAKRQLKQKSQTIAGELKARAAVQHGSTEAIVRLAPKVKRNEKNKN